MASISELEKWVHDQKLRRWTRDHMASSSTSSILNHIFINAASASSTTSRVNSQAVTNPQNVQRNNGRNNNRNRFARNIRLFFQQRNGQVPPEPTFVARAHIPSVYKRVFAEIIGKRLNTKKVRSKPWRKAIFLPLPGLGSLT